MDIYEFGTILQNEVNSGLISRMNHEIDNFFLKGEPIDVLKAMEKYDMEPVGICKNVPFPCSSSEHSVAFVFKDEEELKWVHFPEMYWFSLLHRIYGYDEADKIVMRIMEN